MKKLYRLFAAIASASMLLFAAASCTDTMSELSEEIPLSRCLTPTDLVSRVHGGQYVDFSWTKTRGADTFVLEVFDEDDLKVEDVVDLKKMDESTPVRTMTVPSDQTLPVTMYLDPDEVYYARVKASDSTNAKEDSHFANFPKKIETIAIKDGLNPVLVSRTGTSITIKWTADPEVDHIRITPPLKEEDGEYTRFELNDNAVKAAQVEVTGLNGSTYYTLTVHYSSADRGSVTAWTLPDAGKAVTAVDTAQFKQLVADGATIIAVPYADTAYVVGNVDIVKPLTIMGIPNEEGTFPTLVGGFKLESAATYFSLQGLKLDGESYKYGHVITLAEAIDGLSVDVINCEFSAFTKGAYYDNFASNVSSVVFDGCLFTDFQPSGGDFFDVRQKATYGSFVIKNSTFDTIGRDFMRFDGNVTLSSLILDHCTLSNVCSKSSSHGVLYVRGTVEEFVVSNNLFVNEMGGETNKNALLYATTYKVPVFAGNYFFNCGDVEDYFLKNAVALAPDAKLGECILKNDPCQDSGLSQFNLVNAELIALGVGDPRWLEEFIEVPEELTQGITVPVKTWDLTDNTVFYKSASKDMVRDGIRFYIKDNPVVFESDGFLFSAAATLEAGVPADCGLGIKVNAPGSLVLSTGTIGEGSGLVVVSKDGKPAIGVPAGASNTKVVFDAIAEETMIYVYGTDQVKLTGLQWSDDIDTGGSNVLDDPAPVIDITSVNQGEDKTVTVSWDSVPKAGAYGITINGVDKAKVTDTKYEIATKDLAAGEYVVGVTSLPAETDLVREASQEVTVKFSVKEILRQLTAETVWDSLYFKACNAKFGADAVKDDFVEKNLGYVNGGGSGFKFAISNRPTTGGDVYRAQLAGSGTFKDGALTKCGMQIMVGGNGTLEIHAAGTGADPRVLLVNGVENAITAAKVEGVTQDPTVVKVEVTANAGDLVSWCSKSGGINIFYVKWTPSASAPITIDETDCITEEYNADFSDGTVFPTGDLTEVRTIEKVTYTATSGKKMTFDVSGKRLKFNGASTVGADGIPTDRCISFKTAKPGTITHKLISGSSSDATRKGYVILVTTTPEGKKVTQLYGEATPTSSSSDPVKTEITAAQLEGITEAAVVYIYAGANINCYNVGFKPAS